MRLQIRFGAIEVHTTINKDYMLKVYTKNGIELIDESLNTKFSDYELNFEKNLIIDSNNNLVYSVNGDFVGKILGDNDVPHIVLPYCYFNEIQIFEKRLIIWSNRVIKIINFLFVIMLLFLRICS